MLGVGALALLALVAGPVLARLSRRRARAAARPVNDHAAATARARAADALRLASPVAGALLAERFEARRRGAGQRLTTLVALLRDADPQTARALLTEAEDVTHVLAGTAGMFGEAGLAKAARRAEAEIRAALRGGGEGDFVPAIERLIAALDAPEQRPDSHARLRA